MKNLLLLLFCSLLLSNSTEAQQTKRYGGIGFFSFGMADLQQPGLNAQLTAASYTPLQSRQLSVGGEGFGIINNFLLGGRGGSMGRQQFSSANNTGSIQNSYGSFLLGYTFALSKKLLFYPLVGFGGIDSEITIENNTTSNSITAAFVNPNQITVIRAEVPILDFSVNFALPIIGNVNGGGGPIVGLSAGYFFSPGAGRYRMNGRDLTDIPTGQNNGFYVRLLFGGGGFGG